MPLERSRPPQQEPTFHGICDPWLPLVVLLGGPVKKEGPRLKERPVGRGGGRSSNYGDLAQAASGRVLDSEDRSPLRAPIPMP